MCYRGRRLYANGQEKTIAWSAFLNTCGALVPCNKSISLRTFYSAFWTTAVLGAEEHVTVDEVRLQGTSLFHFDREPQEVVSTEENVHTTSGCTSENVNKEKKLKRNRLPSKYAF